MGANAGNSAVPMPPPGARATAGTGPQQVGSGSGLAPWLRQGTQGLAPLQDARKLGYERLKGLDEQRGLADELRGTAGGGAAPGAPAPAAPAGGWTDRKYDFGGVDKGFEDYGSPYERMMKMSSQALRENPSGMLAELSPEQQRAVYLRQQGNEQGFGSYNDAQKDPYNFGSDYGAFYDKSRGAGALEAEANRYAQLDAAGKLGEYESKYGEFPEQDAAALEQWLRRAAMGGTRTAGLQDMIAQNARTDMTEAGIMMAVGAGLGGAAGIGSLGSAWGNAGTLASGAYGAG